MGEDEPRELGVRELSLLIGTDPLRRWMAQDRSASTRAWRGAADAAAIARPALAQRDRLLLLGEPQAATRLARALLPQLGPTYRPFGDRALIDHLLARSPELERRGEFYWMWRSGGPEVGSAQRITHPSSATWADPEDMPAIAELVARNFPDSYAQPGRAGVQRWAKIALGNRIVATGAWAWSAAGVGLLSGVTVDAELRRKGLGREIADFLAHKALRAFGTVGLLADEGNVSALSLYRSMGLNSTPLLAARVRTQ